nr:hypothetical protein CFP56_12617 [Quercus suber]
MASTTDQLNLEMESIKKDFFKLAMKANGIAWLNSIKIQWPSRSSSPGIFVDELEQEPSDHLTKSLNGQTIQNLEIVFVDEIEKEPSDHLPAIPEIIVGGEIKIEEKEPSDYPATGTKNGVHDQKKQKYPENYKTCVNFLQLFWTVVSVELNVVRKVTDAQNPKRSKDAYETGNQDEP